MKNLFIWIMTAGFLAGTIISSAIGLSITNNQTTFDICIGLLSDASISEIMLIIKFISKIRQWDFNNSYAIESLLFIYAVTCIILTYFIDYPYKLLFGVFGGIFSTLLVLITLIICCEGHPQQDNDTKMTENQKLLPFYRSIISN